MITFKQIVLTLGLLNSFILVASTQTRRLVIYPETSQVTFTTRDTKKLTCKFEGDAASMLTAIRWTGPNREDNAEDLKRTHHVYEENGLSKLTFKKPKIDDSGTYYCFGVYQSTDYFNASIKVKVTHPIEFKNCNERQFLIKGSRDGKVDCTFTAEQTQATLLKDEKQLTDYFSRYHWNNADAIQINGEVDESDAGIYHVEVTSLGDGSSEFRDIVVEVHSKPEIAPFNGTDTNGEYRIIGGQSASIECKVSGTPRPLVYWLGPSLRNLSSTAGYIVDPVQGTLTILNADRVNDRGTFHCNAYNTVGTATRSLNVSVDSKPNVLAFHNVTVNEKMPTTLECRATGEPQPNFSIRQKDSHTALRLGDGLVTEETIEPEKDSGVYIYRLKMTPNRNHFGVYFCNATNRAGHGDRLNQLYVNFGPDLSRTPSEQYVIRGKPFSPTCHVVAHPKPSITWFIDGVELKNVVAHVETFEQTYMITMMPPEQTFSRITCRARNEVGENETVIIPHYTTVPGEVTAQLLETTPTTIKLLLSVHNDGGARVKSFEYKLEGRTLDVHNPLHFNRIDRQNGTIIVPLYDPKSTYTVRNLLPFYRYTLNIRAVNEVGAGDSRDIPVETLKAKSPEPPIITKPKDLTLQTTSFSDYRNGYLLKWSPPELDNGEPVTKYLISYNELVESPLGNYKDVGSPKVIEHWSENALHSKIGPLEPNHRYRIQVQAVNKYGPSQPDYIVITAKDDRPPMPEFEELTWTKDPVTYIVLIVVAVCILVFLDLICCYSFQIGLSYKIRHWCCPVDSTNSVLSDKPPPAQQ